MKSGVVFYVDGNSEIGSGHVMRCLTIADEVKSRGKECALATSSTDFLSLIESHGHEAICFDSDYKFPCALDSCRVITENKPQMFIVDSYYVTEEYLNSVWKCSHENGGRLTYIDDLLSFPYTCDILLNYNIYGIDCAREYEEMSFTIPKPELLLGPAYAPIRREFRDLPKRALRKNGRDILISTGGADNEHIAVEIAKQTAYHPEFKFHIVIGTLNKDRDIVKHIAESLNNVVIHENVTDMCMLMQSVDVAISAAGSTLYELCATQTPTITYVLADNQIPGAECFDRHGIMNNVGDIRKMDKRAFSVKLLTSAIDLCNDFKRRVDAASIMSEVVDGNGCARIVDTILRTEGRQCVL